MRIHSKLANTKGLVSTYNEALRFRDMITQEATERARILTFWNNHGQMATKEAFNVSRPTLFRWQKTLTEAGGKLEALVPRSTAPKRKRHRVIPPEVQDLIFQEREMEKIGKEKLSKLLKDDRIADISASTIGRMLGDLKKQGQLPDPVKYSLSGRTGRMIERYPRKTKKKLRSKGHEGGLVKADTIVRFTNGIKRYILTAIDLESEFAFAYGYTSHASKPASDFMKTFKSGPYPTDPHPDRQWFGISRSLRGLSRPRRHRPLPRLSADTQDAKRD